MVETVVQQQYDHLAKIYDKRWQSYVINTLNFLKQWTQIHPQSVLDVACGTGEFERLLLQDHPNQKIVGIDISAEMIAIAKSKLHSYSSVSFHQGGVTAIPSASESFDVVICASSFHYFDAPLDALAEMKRVLKPGGKLIILDWCKDFLLCRFCDAALKVFDPAHKQCYTQQEFHNFLVSSQLNIQAAKRLRSGWVWGLMVATAIKD